MNPSKADVNGNTPDKLIKVASCSDGQRQHREAAGDTLMSMREACSKSAAAACASQFLIRRESLAVLRSPNAMSSLAGAIFRSDSVAAATLNEAVDLIRCRLDRCNAGEATMCDVSTRSPAVGASIHAPSRHAHLDRRRLSRPSFQ
jgi:hypothetical protein